MKSVGDANFLVVRNGQIIRKSPCEFISRYADKDQYSVKLEKDDVIVMASNTLWENLEIR